MNLDVDQPALPESWMTIVGIVGDIRRAVERDAEPMMYVPLAQHLATNDFGMFLFVSADGLSPEAAAAEAAATLRAINPLAPITREQSMRSHLGVSAMVPRFGFTLFALFASLAIVLTAFGVYAVVAAAIGLVIGTAAYWWSSRALQSFLVRVPAFDVVILAALVGGIALIALAAIAVPSRRALAVDPAITLHNE